MRIDLYTKIILTVIALLLAVIALTPFVQPQPAMAQGSFNGVQMMSGEPNHLLFFNIRTGDIWRYNLIGEFLNHRKLVELGKDLEH
jgi:hypothetical protein